MTASSSDRTEPVPVVVPRFGPAVQSELAPRAPTPWTSRYARRAADTATACFAICTACDPRPTPTARRAAGPPLVAARCGLPGLDTSAVPKAVSTIATGNAPIVTAVA